MAFDFLGTFNKSQFDRFLVFARGQIAGVAGRLQHVAYEKNRLGTLSFEYEGGRTPTSYTASGPSTYMGGLIAAYEALGGDVIYDLQVRSTEQALYISQGSEGSAPQTMSNGEFIGDKGAADLVSSEAMRVARTWLEAPLQYKRNYLERKIRRALDYAEQLSEEETQLRSILGDATKALSLEWLAVEVQKLIDNPMYRTIFDDKGADPHGRTVNAPFMGYSQEGSTLPSAGTGEVGRDYGGLTTA